MSETQTESAQTEPELLTERVQIVISPSLVRRVDAWRGQQIDVPNRSKAIRMLLEHSLTDQRQEA